ncbi:MAG: Arm DNA-binding domain-containing protein, partial [Gammaproteobacteria bacterium]|nr:Arm DNA-binding domain-containing protein [Gammaproteobacteria bacterium]
MINRPKMLSATFVKNVNVPGRYGDGRGGLGLTLRVKPASRGGYCKSWAQSIRIRGQKTTIGLGVYPVITLAMARERAVENARAIAQGGDPRHASNGVPTFAKTAETVIAIHSENWKPGSRS